MELRWHRVAEAALRGPRCLLLVGAPGTGKTAFLERVSRGRRGLPPVVVHCTVETGQAQLFGPDLPLAAAASRGPVTRALLDGRDLLLEDVHRIPPEVRGSLAPLRDGRVVRHPFTGEEMPVSRDFRLLATSEAETIRCRRGGPGADALLDGFVVLEIPEPSPEELRLLLSAHHPEATEARVDRVLEQWVSYRELARAQVGNALLGPRSALHLLELLECGMAEEDAVPLALVHRLVLERELHEAAKLQWSFGV